MARIRRCISGVGHDHRDVVDGAWRDEVDREVLMQVGLVHRQRLSVAVIEIVDRVAIDHAAIVQADRHEGPERAVRVGDAVGQHVARLAGAEHDGEPRALVGEIALDLFREGGGLFCA